MNETKPIKSRKMIRNILVYLKNKNTRDFIMFLTGIHTGLRITDLLRLRVVDVRDRNYIYVKEGKTNKPRKILISTELKREIKAFCKGKEHYEYLFKSREGENNPISRSRAHQILKETGEVFGIDIACHTLRKTFGYDHYKRNKNVAILMEIFNHSTERMTLIYIGVYQEDLDGSMDPEFL